MTKKVASALLTVALAVGLALPLSAPVGAVVGISIGDFVWEDANANGIQDNGEVGIDGVMVELYKCDGTYVGETTTKDGGYYSFTFATPGEYYLKFIAPAGYIFSPQDQGTDDSIDSDAHPTTGLTACTTLDSGENDTTWDAGLYRTASIGDFVWEDTDADGIQENGEVGKDGVTVELYICGGAMIASTVTHDGGLYSFTDLTPGDYSLKFIAPEGYHLSPLDQGTDDAVDSDADPTTGQTVCTTLESGENDTTWDAGLYTVEECGECEGGVTSLTLKYLGSSTADITVIASKKTVFEGSVEPGETFKVLGPKKNGTLGAEIKIYENGKETKIHTSCSQPIGPGLVSGNFEVIEGTSLYGGILCPVSPGGETGECLGGVTWLRLQYLGSVTADITVIARNGTVFEGTVAPDGEFEFNGIWKAGKLGPEINICTTIDGITSETTIHTSCSQPIGIGMVVGDFKIVDGESAKGGKLPPYP